ncbi:MAG: hydrogenase small subunit [Actinomycetota bacterium]
MASSQTSPPLDDGPKVGGLSRRQFMKWCSVITAALALPVKYNQRIANALTSADRPPVVWLEFQDCTGDSEAFLRSSHPTPAEVILDLISLNYHETLMAPAGKAAEKSLHDTITSAKGKYLVVVEGSIPLAADGAYCTIAGRSAVEILKEVAADAAAIVAVGTCAAYGGLPAAAPNPTNAVGVRDIIKNKPILNLAGCAVNGLNITATIAHFLTFGALPAADDEGRPLFAYGALIHDNCPRRGWFDTGRFVQEWGDQGHRDGWCLYKMGCKGPKSHNNCPQIGFNDNTSWPIGAGHPCIACSEPGFWDGSTPFYAWMGEKHLPAFANPEKKQAPLGLALGAAGAAAFAGVGAGAMAWQKKQQARTAPESEQSPSGEGR